MVVGILAAETVCWDIGFLKTSKKGCGDIGFQIRAVGILALENVLLVDVGIFAFKEGLLESWLLITVLNELSTNKSCWDIGIQTWVVNKLPFEYKMIGCRLQNKGRGGGVV